MYHAEKQLLKALPKMAKAATSDELREALESHLEETQGQVARLEQVFELLDEKPRGKHCAGMAGIIEEGNAMLEEDFEGAVMDACIIAAGQRSEHYEMAAYGTCVAWAEALGLTEAAQLLNETLTEEKAADQKLSAIAEGDINEAATAGADEDDEEDEDAKPSKQTSQAAARSSKSAKSPAVSRRRVS